MSYGLAPIPSLSSYRSENSTLSEPASSWIKVNRRIDPSEAAAVVADAWLNRNRQTTRVSKKKTGPLGEAKIPATRSPSRVKTPKIKSVMPAVRPERGMIANSPSGNAYRRTSSNRS